MGNSMTAEEQQLSDLKKYMPRSSELMNSKTAGLLLKTSTLTGQPEYVPPKEPPKEGQIAPLPPPPSENKFAFKAHLSTCGDIESRFVGKRIQQISGSRRGERKVFFIKPKPEKDPTAPPVPAKPRSAWFGAPNKLQLEAKAMLGIGIESEEVGNAEEQADEAVKKLERFETKWEIGKMLGGGSFGKVYTCSPHGWFRVDWEPPEGVVAKVIPWDYVPNFKALLAELHIWTNLDSHPHIVPLLRIYGEHPDSQNLHLMMPHLKGGDLFDRATSQKLSERDTARYVEQMASGLGFLHSMGIYHRDLKPENMLFASNEPDCPLQLSDVRLNAAMMTPEMLMEDLMGVPGYHSPEVIGGIAYSDTADVWSLGVIAYILFSGEAPFDQEDVSLDSPVEVPFDDKLWPNPKIKELVASMLTHDPDKRIRSYQVLDNDWLVSHSASLTPLNNQKGIFELQKHSHWRRAKLKLKAATRMAASARSLLGKSKSIAAMSRSASVATPSALPGRSFFLASNSKPNQSAAPLALEGEASRIELEASRAMQPSESPMDSPVRFAHAVSPSANPNHLADSGVGEGELMESGSADATRALLLSPDGQQLNMSQLKQQSFIDESVGLGVIPEGEEETRPPPPV